MGEYEIYGEHSSPETAINEPLTRVRGDFIGVFNPNVIEGDLNDAVAEGNNLAISQNIAKKLFENESAIGKTIIDYNTNKPYTIRAVLEDFPENCSLKNGVFSYLPQDSWSQRNYVLYMKIKSENRKQLETYINSDDFWGEGFLQGMEDNPELRAVYSTVPLIDIHLKYPEKGGGDLNTTLALLAIAILTLVIAYINFINFTIAMTPARMKALNIQRILGANKYTQRFIIASEAAIFSIIAFLIALLFISLIKSSFISELFSANIAIRENLYLISIFGILAILLGFIFGLYPSWRITNFDIVESLKGTSSNNKRTSKLRSALIVFQFTATISLVIVTLFIKQQHDYMLNYSWGIEKENIVYMDIKDKGINYKTFTNELLKDTQITDYTLSGLSTFIRTV